MHTTATRTKNPQTEDELVRKALTENRTDLIRSVCQNDITTFGRYVDPIFREKFPPGTKHMEKIGEVLMGVLHGDIKRLFIGLPPRNGKSYGTSRLFPPFVFLLKVYCKKNSATNKTTITYT